MTLRAVDVEHPQMALGDSPGQGHVLPRLSGVTQVPSVKSATIFWPDRGLRELLLVSSYDLGQRLAVHVVEHEIIARPPVGSTEVSDQPIVKGVAERHLDVTGSGVNAAAKSMFHQFDGHQRPRTSTNDAAVRVRRSAV